MNSREFEKLLGTLCPRSETDLDVRGRKLREYKDKLRANERLPIGGRGPHAPKLDEHHVAIWLLAACGTRNAVDAAEAVKEFSRLAPVDGPENSFAGSSNFLDAVAEAVRTFESAIKVTRIIFWHKSDEDSGPRQKRFAWAEIVWKDDPELDGVPNTTLYVPASIAKTMATPATLGTSMHDCTIIGSGLLQQIAIELNDDDDEGELLKS